MNKQAGETTYEARPGAVVNTMLNPIAGRLGDRYVPKWFQPSGGTTSGEPTAGDKLLFSVLALAGTYGTATAMGRLISSRLTKDTYENKFKRQMASYLNAQMPIVSPEPMLNRHTLAENEKEKYLGVPETPEEGLKPEFMKKLSSDSFNEMWSMVIPALAIAGGSYAAFKVVDHLDANRRLKELDTETDKERARLDKLNYQYMIDARNPNKSPMVEKMSMEKEGAWYDPSSYSIPTSAGEALGTLPPAPAGDQTLGGGAKALMLLVAATAFGVGTIASKNYFDSRDVNRERLKIMRDTMRGVASADNPPVIMPIMDPKTMGEMNEHITGGPVRSPKKLTVAPQPRQLGETPYDPNDLMMQKAVNV